MKKFIKKTIAGLIAGVMAVSSMPFTALAADQTPLDEAKTALNNFNYSGISTQSGNWYLSSNTKVDMPANTYANLLFAGDSNADYGDFTNSSSSTKGYLRYQKVVFLYDNITTPRAPIMVVYGATKNANRYIGAITLSDNQYNSLKLIGNWNCSRKKNYGNNWDFPNVWAQNGGDDINPGIDVNNPTQAQIAGSGFANNWNVQPGMANKMEYKGSFTDGVYTQTITPTVDFYQGGDAPYTDIRDTIVGTEKLYAVNYRAVRDKIDAAKTDITSVSYDKYPSESVDNYAKAVKDLTSFNPATDLTFSASSLETDVENAGNKIKGLLKNYEDAKAGLKKNEFQTQEYETALVEAKAKVSETDKYTEDSIAALQKVITEVESQREKVASQDALNALTARLLTAISNLVQKQSTVEFVKYENGSNDPIPVDTKLVGYGEPYPADAGANVKGWVVYTNGGKTKTRLNTLDQAVSVVITEDTKIEAYLSGEAETTNSTKVTFLGRHNQVIAIKYVAENQTPDTSDVKAPKVPFYDFVNWDVSKSSDGKEYTVKAVYTCTQAENDKCIVHFKGKDKEYTYNSYVYLFDAEKDKKYALYADVDCNELLVVLDGVDFYTPQRKHIYVKEYAGTEANVAVMGSFATKKDGQNTAVYNCKFNLPEGATAIEWGVAIKFDNGSVKKFSIKEKSKRNEYTANVKAPSTIKNVTAAAYVTYKQGETEETKMSDFVTVDLSKL